GRCVLDAQDIVRHHLVQRVVEAIDWRRHWACVVHKSNSGNEALFGGCPVFTDGDADYGELSNRDLSAAENPKMPDRSDYFHRLAYAQWRLDEIKGGKPFAAYRSMGLL
ncbi:MAG: hypothetical protein AAGC77_06535, partial [Pseudomonadota bacterium]